MRFFVTAYNSAYTQLRFAPPRIHANVRTQSLATLALRHHDCVVIPCCVLTGRGSILAAFALSLAQLATASNSGYATSPHIPPLLTSVRRCAVTIA